MAEKKLKHHLEDNLDKIKKQQKKARQKTTVTNADKYIVLTKLLKREKGATIEEMRKALRYTTNRSVFDVLEQMNFLLTIDSNKVSENVYHEDGTITQKTVTKYWAIGESPNLNMPEFQFTDEELAVFDQLQGSSELTPALRESAMKLFEKLELLAAERGKRIQIGDTSRRLILNAATINKAVIDSNKTDNTIKAILDVMNRQQCMDLIYLKMNDTEPTPYNNLYPVQLFVSNGDTYLWVLNYQQKLRMLAVERIYEMKVYDIDKEKKETYEKAKSTYDFRKLLSDPFGIMPEMPEPYKIKLWINEEETKYLSKKNWPDTVNFEFNDDGSCIFEAETRTKHECIAWIQARIHRVKILEPQWLKDEIMANLNLAIAQNS